MGVHDNIMTVMIYYMRHTTTNRKMSIRYTSRYGREKKNNNPKNIMKRVPLFVRFLLH